MNMLERLGRMQPGQVEVYHSGYGIKGISPHVLTYVRRLYDAGDVELFQRRGENDKHDYCVQRRKVRTKRPNEHTFKFHGL